MADAARDAGESPANALCRQCGLCCNGTFYGSVLVAEGERAQLERIGLRIVDQEGAAAMAQPCTALRGCLCSVYAERPSACADYECTLRKRVHAGERSLDQAVTDVAEMQALLAKIRAIFDVAPTSSIWEAILALEEPTPEQQRASGRDFADAIDAVAKLLDVGRAGFEPRFAGGPR